MRSEEELRQSLGRLRERAPRHLLFLCAANSARSQMAEGLARWIAPEGTRIESAGSVAAGVHPIAVRVMAELGIDIREQWSKSVEEIDLSSVDAVITLCANHFCESLPLLDGAVREHWPLPDPIGARPDPTDGFRSVRDELRRRITALFARETV